jgi:hypothetical protein
MVLAFGTATVASAVEAPPDRIATISGFAGYADLSPGAWDATSRDISGQSVSGLFGIDPRRGVHHVFSPDLSSDENGRIFGAVLVEYRTPQAEGETKSPAGSYKVVPVNGRLGFREVSRANFSRSGEVVQSVYSWNNRAAIVGSAPRRQGGGSVTGLESPWPASLRATLHSWGGSRNGQPLNPRQNQGPNSWTLQGVSVLATQSLALATAKVDVNSGANGSFTITPASVTPTNARGHAAVRSDAFWSSPWGERGGGAGAVVLTPQRRVLAQGAPFDFPGQALTTMRNRQAAAVHVAHLYEPNHRVQAAVQDFKGVGALDTLDRQTMFSTPQSSRVSRDIYHPQALLRPVPRPQMPE